MAAVLLSCVVVLWCSVVVVCELCGGATVHCVRVFVCACAAGASADVLLCTLSVHFMCVGDICTHPRIDAQDSTLWMQGSVAECKAHCGAFQLKS